MGKSRKSRTGVSESGGELNEVVISLIETTLRERLGQRSLPPEICGFEKERRYFFLKINMMPGTINVSTIINRKLIEMVLDFQ